MRPITPHRRYKSRLNGNRWPGVLPPFESQLLALQHQFEYSEALAADIRQRAQFEQIRLVLRHALAGVPYYRNRLPGGAVRWTTDQLTERWGELPILHRAALQQAGRAMHSREVPGSHGAVRSVSSSGSTGRPVSVQVTELVSFMWLAFTLRDHLWHGRYLPGKLASIRSDRGKTPPEGATSPGWGRATSMFETGPAFVLDPGHDLLMQARWLERVQPDYLLGFPSNLRALGERFARGAFRMPALRELRTFGETVAPELRSELETLWKVKVVDAYSAQEVGYLALQCPASPVYHVQSENVLLEILDEADQPCQPGGIGRVVVTTLHNFATPLIRYEIGDWAELGSSPCACGRTLPVITRILGRSRNLLKLPDGSSHWPSFLAARWQQVDAVRQLQLVQTDLSRITMNLVVERPLVAVEEQQLREIFQELLGYPFHITMNYVAEIPRSPSGKYEDFICRV